LPRSLVDLTGRLLVLELDEELLCLPDAVLGQSVDVGGGDLALLGVDEGFGRLVSGEAGDLGESGVSDGLVRLGDPRVGVVSKSHVGVDGDLVGRAVGAGHGGEAVLGSGKGGGHQTGEDDRSKLKLRI
jgi:hypothetical protein